MQGQTFNLHQDSGGLHNLSNIYQVRCSFVYLEKLARTAGLGLRLFSPKSKITGFRVSQNYGYYFGGPYNKDCNPQALESQEALKPKLWELDLPREDEQDDKLSSISGILWYPI